MKKVWIVILLALVLSGCSAADTFETIGDAYDAVQVATPLKLTFTAPADAAAPVMHGENGTLYFCDGYEIMVQTLSGGDLNRSLRSLTGYDADALTVMKTEMGNMVRYECAWISAGEAGDHIGRTVIIDDGQFHYSLSVMAPAEEAGSLQESWQELFSSVEIQS